MFACPPACTLPSPREHALVLPKVGAPSEEVQYVRPPPHTCAPLRAQVGVPSDKAQYVHRVGRTARAGKRGQALLMLCDFEAAFLDKVRAAVGADCWCTRTYVCVLIRGAHTHTLSFALLRKHVPLA